MLANCFVGCIHQGTKLLAVKSCGVLLRAPLPTGKSTTPSSPRARWNRCLRLPTLPARWSVKMASRLAQLYSSTTGLQAGEKSLPKQPHERSSREGSAGVAAGSVLQNMLTWLQTVVMTSSFTDRLVRAKLVRPASTGAPAATAAAAAGTAQASAPADQPHQLKPATASAAAAERQSPRSWLIKVEQENLYINEEYSVEFKTEVVAPQQRLEAGDSAYQCSYMN